MEASKRERLILFGIVPIVAAIAGAVATVVISRMTGSAKVDDVMLEIIKMQGVTAEQKAKLMELANQSTSSFYTWLSSVGFLFAALIGFLGPSIAARIRGER